MAEGPALTLPAPSSLWEEALLFLHAEAERVLGEASKPSPPDGAALLLAQALLASRLRGEEGAVSGEDLLAGRAPLRLAPPHLREALEGLAGLLPPPPSGGGALLPAFWRAVRLLKGMPLSALWEEPGRLGEAYLSLQPRERRRAMGETYTPDALARWTLERTLAPLPRGARALDPAAGAGVFLLHRLGMALEAGLSPEEALEGVWGFEINPYAAYLAGSLLLLRAGFPEGGGRVRVYALDSLGRGGLFSPEGEGEGERARDGGTWEAVVGNPPYVRTTLSAEARRNGNREAGGVDLGLRFLGRALGLEGGPSWVAPGGRLGLVLSGGYASTAEAEGVWRAFWPGKGWALEALVWLEFVENVGRRWDADALPMVLLAERRRAGGEVVLWVPPSWPPGEEGVSRIPVEELFHPAVSPSFRSQGLPWGSLPPPLLKREDVPLLKRLWPTGERYVPLEEGALGSPWRYGSPPGGVPLAPEGGVPLYGGEAFRFGALGEPKGWLPAGEAPGAVLGEGPWVLVPKIVRAPFAVLHPGGIALNKTVLYARPRRSLEGAVAAYLSSSLARWYWALRFRAGVVLHHYSTVYARGLALLPWPARPDPALLRPLEEAYWRAWELAGRGEREGALEALEALDGLVFAFFGLSEAEAAWVRERVGSFPLRALGLRFPWKGSPPPEAGGGG